MTRAKAHLSQPALEESVSSEETDDLVDQWHAMPNPPCELHEWLGMSWEDYKECFGNDSMPTSEIDCLGS